MTWSHSIRLNHTNKLSTFNLTKILIPKTCARFVRTGEYLLYTQWVSTRFLKVAYFLYQFHHVLLHLRRNRYQYHVTRCISVLLDYTYIKSHSNDMKRHMVWRYSRDRCGRYHDHIHAQKSARMKPRRAIKSFCLCHSGLTSVDLSELQSLRGAIHPYKWLCWPISWYAILHAHFAC